MKDDTSKILKKLISSFLNGQINTSKFCSNFETLYNENDIDDAITPQENELFDNIFNTVTWYSPFPEEREKIANYIGEHEVFNAVKNLAKALEIETK
ncbi:MAG: hypothetical protein ACTS1Z_01935 [Parasphingopyxis sp.]|uniref:hypothetical protein n=1 Tax=Parasphingopyxis sp. TaxID=1920299 RepID=UPI003FA10547